MYIHVQQPSILSGSASGNMGVSFPYVEFPSPALCMLNSFGTNSFASLHKPEMFIPLKKELLAVEVVASMR
jgi:hypothetical protein